MKLHFEVLVHKKGETWGRFFFGNLSRKSSWYCWLTNY